MPSGWWYKNKAGRVVGPVSAHGLGELLSSRSVSIQTSVSHETVTRGEWVQLHQLVSLRAIAKQAADSPPKSSPAGQSRAVEERRVLQRAARKVNGPPVPSPTPVAANMAEVKRNLVPLATALVGCLALVCGLVLSCIDFDDGTGRRGMRRQRSQTRFAPNEVPATSTVSVADDKAERVTIAEVAATQMDTSVQTGGPTSNVQGNEDQPVANPQPEEAHTVESGGEPDAAPASVDGPIVVTVEGSVQPGEEQSESVGEKSPSESRLGSRSRPDRDQIYLVRGRWLHALMSERGISADQLADATGLRSGLIKLLARTDKMQVSKHTVGQLAAGLGCRPDEISVRQFPR